jgi:membrane protein
MATRRRDDPSADGYGDPANRIRRDYRPSGTYDKATRFGVLRRTATEFREDNLTDWAAALTYYGLLALFPALIALVSIVGVLADPQATAQKLTEIVTLSDSVNKTIVSMI